MNDSLNSNAQPGTQRAFSPEADREDEIDLARLWALLWGGRWKIAAFVAATLACAIFYLFIVQPTYRADALIQIQSEGSSPLQGLTSDLQGLTGTNSSPAQGEIPIIKSRSVLGETVNKLRLDTVVTPAYFPLIGWAVASRSKPGPLTNRAVSADAGSWISNYAWQPTTLSLSRMMIPQGLYDEAFTLRALGGDRFILYGPQGDKILEGKAGEPAAGRTVQNEEAGLFVQEIAVSAPPTDFTLVHRGWLPVVEELQEQLVVSEQGDDTGVVRISLEGHDREKITTIVNSIAQNYLRQNVEARSKQAEKSLEFLDERLPEMSSDLEGAEANLTQYQENNQTVDLDAEGQALLDQVVALEDKRSQLELKRAELRQTYTGAHPALQAAQEQMRELDKERQQLQAQIGKLPGNQKEMFGLRRDVEVNTQLYTAMLNRAQELRVVKAGTIGNVRIIDDAVEPVESVSPKTLLILALSLLLGGMLGCGFVLVRAALRRGVDDPKDIENRLGMPVYAVVPFSSWLARRSNRAQRRNETSPILARDHGDEVAVEALRSLRTSLYFAQMDSGSNVILVTGPAPGVGKSFVSTNLAYLLSEVDQSVVIVDADMRKGRLHEYVDGKERDPGLSQVLTGHVPLQETLRSVEGSKIKILTSGQIPPNPSELLMRESFPKLLDELKSRFDLVLIDAPPIMAVTDAAVIAATIPGIITFMVARAGVHPMAEIEEAVNRMTRNDQKVAGVVFNGYQQQQAEATGSYGYYQYEYKGSV